MSSSGQRHPEIPRTNMDEQVFGFRLSRSHKASIHDKSSAECFVERAALLHSLSTCSEDAKDGAASTGDVECQVSRLDSLTTFAALASPTFAGQVRTRSLSQNPETSGY